MTARRAESSLSDPFTSVKSTTGIFGRIGRIGRIGRNRAESVGIGRNRAESAGIGQNRQEGQILCLWPILLTNPADRRP